MPLTSALRLRVYLLYPPLVLFHSHSFPPSLTRLTFSLTDSWIQQVKMPANGNRPLKLQFGLINHEGRYLTAEAFGFKVQNKTRLSRGQIWGEMASLVNKGASMERPHYRAPLDCRVGLWIEMAAQTMDAELDSELRRQKEKFNSFSHMAKSKKNEYLE